MQADGNDENLPVNFPLESYTWRNFQTQNSQTSFTMDKEPVPSITRFQKAKQLTVSLLPNPESIPYQHSIRGQSSFMHLKSGLPFPPPGGFLRKTILNLEENIYQPALTRNVSTTGSGARLSFDFSGSNIEIYSKPSFTGSNSSQGKGGTNPRIRLNVSALESGASLVINISSLNSPLNSKLSEESHNKNTREDLKAIDLSPDLIDSESPEAEAVASEQSILDENEEE